RWLKHPIHPRAAWERDDPTSGGTQRVIVPFAKARRASAPPMVSRYSASSLEGARKGSVIMYERDFDGVDLSLLDMVVGGGCCDCCGGGTSPIGTNLPGQGNPLSSLLNGNGLPGNPLSGLLGGLTSPGGPNHGILDGTGSNPLGSLM